MTPASTLVKEPELAKLLQRRNRWRWSLSGTLVVAYFIYAFVGLHFTESYAAGFAGTRVPLGIVVGMFLIALSVAASLLYIRIVSNSSDSLSERHES